MEPKGKKLIKDIFVFGLGSVGSRLILFFLVPLYTNFMTKAEYGTADLVFTLAQIIIPIMSVTIFDAVLRFGLIKANKPEDVLLCAFTVLGAGTAALVIITPLFSLYPAVSEWKWYLCCYSALSMGVFIELNYLKVQDRNFLYSLASIAQTLVLAVMNIILISKYNLGVKGYLLSNIIAGAFTFTAIFIVGRFGRALSKARLKKELLHEMLIYSAPLIINNISWWVIHSSDKIMLQLMLSTSALGIYTVATKIPSLINTFIAIFSQAWGLSAIKEIEETEDTRFYTEVFSLYCALAFVAAAVLISVTKPFMKIYVGEDFLTAWRYVPLLLFSAVFSAVSAFYGSMYGALKKSTNNMRTTLAAAILNIVLNFVFIRICGIWGAVIGTAAAYLAVALLRACDVQRFIKIDIAWGSFAVSSLLILLQALAVSLDIAPVAVSAVAVAGVVVLNRKTLRSLSVKLKTAHEVKQ